MYPRIILFSITLFLYSGLLHAELPSTKNLEKWAASPLKKDIHFLYQHHKIELIYSPLFSQEEVTSFTKGAASLPRSYFRSLGKPIRIKRVAKPCIFGIGRDNKGCPSVDKSGAFLIYDLPPVQGEGPVERYDQLTSEQSIDLQRRRAIVHAVFYLSPDLRTWSEEQSWKDINGWTSENAVLNRDAWGFSRYLGASSPKFDLITFAESFFIRFQDITPEKLDPNRSVQCQSFSKSRFFKKHIAQSDPKWFRPYYRSCPDFETWANLSSLKSIDILLASATADRPESLYGHLLLHLVYEGRSRGFEPVYQFGVVTDSDVGFIDYFVKGLLGGFISILDVSSYRSTDKRLLRFEGRNIKRFKLNLSPKQRAQMLERIWEIERRHRYSYVFFFNNCASFLYDLVGGALDIHFPGRSSFIISPSDVLDAFAEVDNGKRGKLLTKEPLIHLSSRERALQSIVLREDLLEEAGLKNLTSKLNHYSAKKRLMAYKTLAKTLEKIAAKDFKKGLDILHASVVIERYFAEHADYLEKKLKIKQLKIAPRSAETLLKKRRLIFAEKKVVGRYEKLFEEATSLEEKIETLQIDKEEHQEALQWIADTRAAYLEITHLMGDYIEANRPDFDGFSYLEERKKDDLRLAKARDKKSIGPSGKGRISLGVANGPDFESLRFRVEGALIKERLGEQRRRGFRSDIESLALDFKTNFPLSDQIFKDIEIDLTVLRFLSASQKLGPLQRDIFDLLGWGFDFRMTRIPRLGVDGSLELSGGLLAPLLKTDHFTSFFVMGLFPEFRMSFGESGKKYLFGGGAWARLQLHLFGRYPNIMEFEINSKHFFELSDSNYDYETQARFGFQFLPFFSGDKPAFLRPYVSASLTNMIYKDENEVDSFVGRIDYRTGLDFELPF